MHPHTHVYRMHYIYQRSGKLLYFQHVNDAFKFNWAQYFLLLMMWLSGKIS